MPETFLARFPVSENFSRKRQKPLISRVTERGYKGKISYDGQLGNDALLGDLGALYICTENPVVIGSGKSNGTAFSTGHFSEKRNSFGSSPLFSFLLELSENRSTICFMSLTPFSFMENSHRLIFPYKWKAPLLSYYFIYYL